MTSDSSPARYSCTSAHSLCFWAVAFAVLYGLGLGALYLLHAMAYHGTVLFAAAGIACFLNLARNRSFHCIITGPFFLIVALVLGLAAYGTLPFHRGSSGVVWAVVAVVVGLAFLAERRFAR